MRRTIAVLCAFFGMMGMAVFSVSPSAASPPDNNVQVRGVATFNTDRCPFALDMVPQDDGWGLDGCLNLLTFEGSQSNGGVYKERGTEEFVGDIVYSEGGVPDDSTRGNGRFETTYLITSKWAGEPFLSEQNHGRCQHPIIGGSGTGVFDGATGRLDFKDSIVDGIAVEFPFRGHVKLAG